MVLAALPGQRQGSRLHAAGRARTLGSTVAWRFLSASHAPPHEDTKIVASLGWITAKDPGFPNRSMPDSSAIRLSTKRLNPRQCPANVPLLAPASQASGPQSRDFEPRRRQRPQSVRIGWFATLRHRQGGKGPGCSRHINSRLVSPASANFRAGRTRPLSPQAF